MHELLYARDKQGNLNFFTRQTLNKKNKKPSNIWENSGLLISILITCAIVDFVAFKQLFDSLLLDSGFIRWTSILGLVFAFDFVPIYFGQYLRKYSQGFDANKTIRSMFIMAFIIGIVSYTYLRVSYQDITLPNFTSPSTSVFGSSVETAVSSIDALPITVMFTAFPLITSLGSFAISYSISNPLQEEIYKKEEILTGYQDNIAKLDALLIEYDNDEDYYHRLLQDDQENYSIIKQQLKEQAEYYRDYVRQKLKEHLGNPVDIGILSEPLEKWSKEEK